MVVKNDRKSSYFEELPPVGAPPSFLPSASVSQPKGNHNEEAYVIFDKSTTLFPKGGLSPIFVCFWGVVEKFLRAKFASLKTEILNFFWCKPWILIISSFFKILESLPEVRPPFLGFLRLFWLPKKDKKDVFCLTKVLKFLWIRPLYQRLCSLEEPKLKCFLNTFLATPLYLICERFIIIFPAQKGIVVLW